MTISVDVGVVVSVASGVPVSPNGTLVGGVVVWVGFMVLVNITVAVDVVLGVSVNIGG